MSDNYFDTVSADKKQIGFEYQDFVCLSLLINMKPGEIVGLEVLDDVHHVKLSGETELIQVKHSVDDETALTNRDIDLWKTIYNWCLATESMSDKDSQIRFVFFTNKKITEEPGIVRALCDDSPNLGSIVEFVNELKADLDKKEGGKQQGSPENPIKKFVDYIFSVDPSIRDNVFGNLSIVHSNSEILSRIEEQISFFAIKREKIADVVHQLLGVFKDKKYALVKGGSKLNIDYDTFRRDFEFDRIIQLAQDRKVDFGRYNRFKDVTTINPKDGLFAKQLADIDVQPDAITDYAIEYAATSMFIQRLILDGDFSQAENQAIDEDLFYGWRTIHEDLYDQPDNDDEAIHNKLARKCLRGVEGLSLVVSDSHLSRPMVRGKGIELSDACRIGWRKDWKNKYGENK